MNLRPVELEILTRLRDGEQPSQIARTLGIEVSAIYTHMKHITNQWKQWAKEWIKLQAYANHLRMELLWNIIAKRLESTKDDPDTKLLGVAIALIEKHNRMIGVSDNSQDSTWLKSGGSFQQIERLVKESGIDVPKAFDVGTGSP